MTDSSLALYSTSGPKKDLALHYVHPDSDDEEEYEIETSKIESQRSAWADFMRELPSEDFTEDPELWQYWNCTIMPSTLIELAHSPRKWQRCSI